LKIFICGPTLYEKCHVGHARIFVFFNFLFNFHKFIGDSPIALLQLTDIDHKIYQKINYKSKKIGNIQDRYLTSLFSDLKSIQVEHNFIYSRVSDFLALIKKDVVNILKTKRGYSFGGNVYLSISDKIVGSVGLTSRDIHDMPIDISIGKMNQRDIMIWNSENFYQNGNGVDGNDGDNTDTFLTSGIPGWHFQDYEIIKNVFDIQYDIHGGARELIYPHHEFIEELSIANNFKSENWKPKNMWMHIGLVKVNSEKMSNSSFNTISISEILRKYSPNALKLFFLSKEYKSDVEFSYEDLDEADRVDKIIASFLLKNSVNYQKCDYAGKPYLMQFLKFLYDDYDTASSVKMVVELANRYQNPQLIKKMVEILGLKYY
jgi:cysteinyl-tRNA synthetase